MVRKGQPHPSQLPAGVAALRQVWRNYKYNAEARGLAWELSYDDVEAIVKQDCRYCGRPPQQQNNVYYRGGRTRVGFLGNGIDRIDNTKGYVEGNVAPCCKKCNHAKRDMTEAEFKEFVGACYKKLFGETGAA